MVWYPFIYLKFGLDLFWYHFIFIYSFLIYLFWIAIFLVLFKKIWLIICFLNLTDFCIFIWLRLRFINIIINRLSESIWINLIHPFALFTITTFFFFHIQWVPELFGHPDPPPCYLMGKCLVRRRLFLLEKSSQNFYFFSLKRYLNELHITQSICVAILISQWVT